MSVVMSRGVHPSLLDASRGRSTTLEHHIGERGPGGTWEGRKAAARPDAFQKLIADGPGGARWGTGRAFQVQHAGDEIADGDAQVAPEPLLHAGIVLRATEEVAHQLTENGAGKLGVFGRDALRLDESLEVAAELGAGMRGHAPADSHREVVVARKGPNVAFKLRKKFDEDGIGVLRDEVALGHFQFVALERPASGHQLISRAGREDKKIRFVPFSLDAITRLGPFDVHTHHAGALQRAAGFLRAVEQQAVQHLSRVNHDGVRHFEDGAMFLAANELNGVNELLGIRIVEQERETLDGFVGESAAAGLLPREMLVKKIHFVTGASELLATHCAGGSAANDCNFGHSLLSLYRSRTQSDAQHALGPVMKEIERQRHPKNATP